MRKILLLPLLVLAIGCTPEAVEPGGGANVEEQTAFPETPPATASLVETTSDQHDLEPPAVGEAAPDFTLESHTGETMTLSGVQGQPVVLAFYRGHW